MDHDQNQETSPDSKADPPSKITRDGWKQKLSALVYGLFTLPGKKTGRETIELILYFLCFILSCFVVFIFYSFDYVTTKLDTLVGLALGGFLAAVLVSFLIRRGHDSFIRRLEDRLARTTDETVRHLQEAVDDSEARSTGQVLLDLLSKPSESLKAAVAALIAVISWPLLLLKWQHVIALTFVGFTALLGEALLKRQLEATKTQNSLLLEQQAVSIRENATEKLYATTQPEQHQARHLWATESYKSDSQCNTASTLPPPRAKHVEHVRVEALKSLVELSKRTTNDTFSNEFVPRIPSLSLPGVILTYTNLTDIDLRGANLTESHLDNVELSDSSLQGARLAKSWLSRAEFTRSDLSSTNLSGIRGSSAKFLSANLTSATFLAAKLDNSEFIDIYERQIDFTRSCLRRANIIRSEINFSDFLLADLQNAIISSSQLRRANFDGANLQSVKITRTDLTGSNFSNADLTGAVFSQVNLSFSNLSGATIVGANLGTTDLKQAMLGIRPAETVIIPADLRGAKLHATLNLTFAQLSLTCGDAETTLPEGFDRPGHWSGLSTEDTLSLSDDAGCPEP